MYLPLYVIYAFIISLGSGTLGAMLGMGGGTIMVPLLIFLLKVPIHVASGASIIAVVATSSAAAVSYVKEEMTNMRLGMFLELATTIGAVTGAFLISVMTEATLRIIFVMFSPLHWISAGPAPPSRRPVTITWFHKGAA